MTYSNGDVYEGDFVNDKLEGNGTLTTTSGKRYVGEFKGGNIEGKGTLYDKEGNILYQGLWSAGNPVSKKD